MADPLVFENDAIVLVTAVANGQTVFAFDFLAFAEADLLVIHRRGTVSTTIAPTTGFTASNLNNENGGSISIAPSGIATLIGDQVLIARNMTIKRLTAYVDDLRSSVLNKEFETVFMLLQQLQRDLSRAAVLPITVAGGISAALPAPGAGQFLRWNLAGTALETFQYVTAGTDVGAVIGASGAKAVPDNADRFGFWDSVSLGLRSLSWANIVTALSALFPARLGVTVLNTVPRFAGTTGLMKTSGVLISDTNTVSGVNDLVAAGIVSVGTLGDVVSQMKPGSMEIGLNRQADGQAWIDFHALAPGNTDYEARIIRQSSTNGAFEFYQTGSGGFKFLGGAFLADSIMTTSGAGIGYATGAGGAVTQATSKSTGVTLNKPSGQITLNGASLGSNTTVQFTLTNNLIEANDVLVLNQSSGGTIGAYMLVAQCNAGSAVIAIRNVTGVSLGEAFVLGFALIKGKAA